VRGPTLPLVLLASLTFLVGLGRGAIADADEAFYAEAAREMVESGDWITPFFNYEVRFQKPILYYWLTAATYLVTGPTESGARLWSALSAVGLVLVTAACARRWLDEGVALLAGAIVATSYGYYALGRMALPDMPLTFCITLAIWAALVATLERERQPRRWVLLSAVGMALGFLAKGPLGVLLPVLVVVPVVVLERRSLNIRAADVALGALVFAIVALPWYGVMYARHGAAYLDGFFIGDNLERFATDRFNDPRGWWFYLPVLAGGLLPWTPFALTWVAPVRDFVLRRRDVGTLELRLLLWALLPLVFFSISVGKQPRYILPVLPPLAMLLASSVLERTRDWRSVDGARVRLTRSRSIMLASLAAGLGLVLLAALLWRVQPLLINVAPGLTWAAAGVIGAGGVAVLWTGLSRAWRSTPAVLAVSTALAFPALQYGALTGSGADTVEQVARAVLDARRSDEEVGTYRVFVRNLVFYTRTPTVDLITDEQVSNFLRRGERVLLVVPAADLASLEQRLGLSLYRLAEFPYFNQAGIRLRTLIQPDPARDITSVVVVANR
jgi:4-amino-4-deoxy-L-arabinose transferase-like glycosyltransferase